MGTVVSLVAPPAGGEPRVLVKFAKRTFTFKPYELRPVKTITPPSSWKLKALELVAFIVVAQGWMIGLVIVVATAVAAQGSEFNWRAPGAGSVLGTAVYATWAMLGALSFAGIAMAFKVLCATQNCCQKVSTGTGMVYSYGSFNY